MKKRKPRTENGPGKTRKLIGTILTVIVIAYTLYLSAIMLHRISTVILKDDYRKIFMYELLLCAILLIFALDVRLGFFTKLRSKPGRIIGWLFRAVIIVLTAVILFFGGRIISGSLIITSGPADYAIVLGLALEDGKPTKDLQYRMETARQYLNEHPDAALILTGGNPDESGKTEAAVMRDLLTELGVPQDKMILEDRAGTTKENFRNTAAMIDPARPVVLISSNYHMDRAVRTAEAAGFTNILRLPAPSQFLCYGANIMWEIVLELNG